MGYKFDFSEFLNDKSKSLEGQEILYISAKNLIPSSGEQNFYHADSDSITKMARSIELVGVQQPLVVKPADVKGKYNVLVGHTRRLAVMQLYEEGNREDDLLPCIVDQSQDDTLQELALIFTNSTQRERTDSEKMREVARLRVLLNEYKETHPDFSGNMQQIIADILGISKSKVGRLDNINNNLSDGLKEEFESGNLNISTANELARLDEEGQSAMEKKIEKQGSLSMQEAKQAYADQLMKASEVGEQEEKEEILGDIKLHQEQLEKAEELSDKVDVKGTISVEDIPTLGDISVDAPYIPEDAETVMQEKTVNAGQYLDKVFEDSREYLSLESLTSDTEAMVEELADDVLRSYVKDDKKPLFELPDIELMNVVYEDECSVYLPDFVFKFYEAVVDMVLNVVGSFVDAEKEDRHESSIEISRK